MWSWVLAIVGCIGIFFVGRKTVWGWLILMLNESLWVIYACTSHQYGFILASVGYVTIYVKSYREWIK
jgi:hypothetical protein